MLWSTINNDNYIPETRAAHSSDKIKNKLYIYGGWNGETALNRLDVLNLATKKWEIIDVHGDIPSSRNNHATCSNDNFLYLHGGHDGFNWLNDYYCFDSNSNSWKNLSSQNFVPFNEDIEKDNTNNNKFNIDIAVNNYNTTDNKLIEVDTNFNNFNNYKQTYELEHNSSINLNLQKSKHIKSKSKPFFIPSARACHTLSLIKDKIYLFGGYDGKTSFNDLLVFNTVTNDWCIELHLQGNPPSIRNAHTATVYGECIYIFGGHYYNNHLNDLHFYNTNNKSWNKVDVNGDVPRAVRGHTATLYYNTIYFFGGFDGKNRSNSLYSLDLSNNKYFKITNINCSNLNVRQRHTANLINQNELMFFGGFEGSTWLNTIDILKLDKLEEQLLLKKIKDKLNSDLKQLLNDNNFYDLKFNFKCNLNYNNLNTYDSFVLNNNEINVLNKKISYNINYSENLLSNENVLDDSITNKNNLNSNNAFLIMKKKALNLIPENKQIYLEKYNDNFKGININQIDNCVDNSTNFKNDISIKTHRGTILF